MLGSGLGGLVDELSDTIAIPYKDIPHFPVSTVSRSRRTSGRRDAGGTAHTVACRGVSTITKGIPWTRWSSIQVMRMLDIRNLLLTNASGLCERELEARRPDGDQGTISS